MEASKNLTKHLYRKEEVLSSLRWSIITHSIANTAFWTLELFESGLVQECTELLETIWFYHIGFGSWFALRLVLNIYEAGDISQEDLLAITCAFARRKLCDSTVFHLLLRGAQAIAKAEANAKAIAQATTFPHSTEYKTVQEAVIDCLKRGKLQEAWLLGRALTEEEQWPILESIATGIGRLEALQVIKELRECRQESLAAAYVLVSLDHISWIQSQAALENIIPKEVMEAIEGWQNEKSMRKRRALSPKPEALYLTARGQQSAYVSSEPDIQHGLIQTLLQSDYWTPILETYMNGKAWKSARHKEFFYDTYFPQDIPDEWSLADREKSHGRGLGKTKEQDRIWYIRLTLQHSKSIELWNSTFPSDLDCSMDWTALYSVRPVISLPMKPVKKVFQII
jgi:hypothetical protein